MVTQPVVNNNIVLNQLRSHCYTIYPQQDKNFIKADKSFLFEGGSDPLDYVYVFKNKGNGACNIPQHWHYVGLGLSNIYNYRQFLSCLLLDNPSAMAECPMEEDIFPPPFSPDKQLSGFGFELTFRLKCNSNQDWDQNKPPKWPCRVLQALARYVYMSKNLIETGENIYWNTPLALTDKPDGDDSHDANSSIRHLLTTTDPQLGETETASGKVRFIQLVGVTREELEAAREWSGAGLLSLMRREPKTGGELLITDTSRITTVLDSDARISETIASLPSNLIMVNAKHKYRSTKPNWYRQVESKPDMSTIQLDIEEQDDECPLTRCPSRLSRISYESESALKLCNTDRAIKRFHDSIYLLLPLRSAKLLPVALERRLSHGKSFTFKNTGGDLFISLIPERTKVESMVCARQPYVRQGVWLHICITDELRSKMVESMREDLKRFSEDKSINLPKNYSWPEHKFYITVVDEIP